MKNENVKLSFPLLLGVFILVIGIGISLVFISYASNSGNVEATVDGSNNNNTAQQDIRKTISTKSSNNKGNSRRNDAS
ncbi:MAG: hypothetical protein Q9M91_08865 [Candidatus Dojkabacteria bacterium]|nr:hypothetical protein [Candidatus Dojkabacteria bacterium]MDQ7021883.1 hypothetical protein [Candidatus Dojkabacteria bacterium]